MPLYRQELSPKETLQPRSRIGLHREPVIPIFRSPISITLTAKLYPSSCDLGVGFEADDGASLLMTFRGLQAEATEHGQLHEAVSNELHTLVAKPFHGWTEEYKVRSGIPLIQSSHRHWPLDETRASKRTGTRRLDR